MVIGRAWYAVILFQNILQGKLRWKGACRVPSWSPHIIVKLVALRNRQATLAAYVILHLGEQNHSSYQSQHRSSIRWSMASPQLTTHQSQALFDILTHHEAYAEIRALRNPATIATFGAPLEPENTTSSSPLVQTLLQRFLLNLPGLRDVSPDFWTRDVKGLATALDDANLSESYDKGSIGIRRTLSTAIAAMVEYVSRGTLGGYPKSSISTDRQYDLDNPDDVVAAWDDFLQQIIYGDLLDRMFKKAAETDQLSDHELVVQAGVKYALVMCEPQ